MVKFLALLALSVFVAQKIHAAPNADSNVIVVKKPNVEVYEESSEANRMNKDFQVDLFTGVGPANGGGMGISAAKFLSRNQLVMIDLVSGPGAYSRRYSSTYNSTTTSGETDTRVSTIGVHYKQFTGNSFYFRTGLDYSTVDYKFDYNSNTPGYGFKSKFNGSVLGANFSIGNQWQWENFTIGCDWIGVSLPLVKDVASAEITGSVADYDRSQFQDDQDHYINNGTATLLKLYVGASF